MDSTCYPTQFTTLSSSVTLCIGLKGKQIMTLNLSGLSFKVILQSTTHTKIGKYALNLRVLN